jgi:hypothetical protein
MDCVEVTYPVKEVTSEARYLWSKEKKIEAREEDIWIDR